MSLRRLHAAEWTAGAGAVLLAVATFVAWYRTHDLTPNAWQAFAVIDFFLALAVLTGLALAVVTLSESRPAIPLGVAVFGALTAPLALLLVVYRLLEHPRLSGAPIELAVGAWLGLAGALLLTAGAWWSMRDERQRGSP